MIFKCSILEYEQELRDILRMFVPFFSAPYDITFLYNKDSGECEIKINETPYFYTVSLDTINEKQLKKELKKRFYLALKEYFGFGLPWGSLTGIRPTKIAYAYLALGKTLTDIPLLMQNDYYVSEKKSLLVAETIKNQTDFLNKFDVKFDDFVNLYIHIPFCPSRCFYCSFVSLPLEKNEGLISEYVQLLCRDIKKTIAHIKSQNKKVLSVYIGGGTPTVLKADELKSVLKAVSGCGLNSGTEFTVEAGRPDTITNEKLAVLKDYGVNRVSVNPQTFNDKTLQIIGRSHNIKDIYAAFNSCKAYGFDVNMDLIAGLPSETLTDFKSSLSSAVLLKPENITVHTLSLKRGSNMNEQLLSTGESPIKADKSIESMTDFALTALKNAKYLPYYLYRQKDMAQNLENTGYCLKDKQSVNNITVMEESVAVYASGAGAISKRIDKNGISRLAELRDVSLYIKQFEERLAKKLDFLR